MNKLNQFFKAVWNYISTPDNIFVGVVLIFLFTIIIGC